jgi:riboflavin kinase/FMN adenylyltransferase
MLHYWSLDHIQLSNVWLTIGSFDGVHLGHQEVVRNLVTRAHQQEAQAVVLTFFPHPAVVLRGRDFPFYLTSPEEKARLLAALGVDVVITHSFDSQVAATPARDFIVKLHEHLQITHLRVGHDFALGKNRQGNVAFLRKLGLEFGYTIEQIEPFELGGDVVSSTHIRFLLGAGQVDRAAQLLGRNYQIEGIVILGDQRGRSIGFPTANLDIWKEQAIPAGGVYISRATVHGITYGAVTNIGVRPTFETSPVPPRVEAHLLEFDQDIYGESVKIEFIQRLRGEIRFPSVDELIAQIQRDVAEAQKLQQF